MIDHADKSTGIILDALQASGQDQDTIVIYTSDHGEMAGSHGLHNKGFIYEESIKVPLMISAPGLVSGHTVREDLTSHIDFVPTLCGLAGIHWPYPLPGKDLEPGLARNQAEPAREIFMEGAAGNLNKTIPWRGIHTGDWKYALYLNGDEQLFYLPQDPLELNNLAQDKNARAEQKELRNKVNNWRIQTNDPFRLMLE